jgi:SEC-C motif-containing protein
LPVIRGKRPAERAQDLLRARYSAFALGEIDFIVKSHHSKTSKDVKRAEVEEWSQSSDWESLEIVQTEAGEKTDTQGLVTFCAKYRPKASAKAAETSEVSEVQDHWEQALFEKEGTEWKFLDARGVHHGPIVRTEPKIGRNDPCTCGSGKKYKKCCAA